MAAPMRPNSSTARDRKTLPIIYQVPAIETAPADRIASAGTVVNFTVTANGTEPLSYQWRVNGLAMPGATNASLTLTNVQASEAGDYHVVVHNAAGFVISEVARLTVNQPLEILAQPLSQYADLGSMVTLNVLAQGTGTLRYQWQRDGVNLTGATNASLVLSEVQAGDSGNYAVVVTDDVQSQVSASATLTVLSPPIILQQPQSQTVVAYTDVYFTVIAGGQGPFAYQWRLNGVNIVGANSAMLQLPNVQSGQAGSYSVEVSNPVSSVVSSNALLTIQIPATITEQPVSQMVDPGATVTFRVVAISTSTMTYQWRLNDQDIPGATGSTLTLANVQEADSGQYQVIVTDAIGSAASEVVLLTVLTAPAITQQPVSVSVVEGGTAVISVETSGALPMGYRWRFGHVTIETNLVYSHQSFLTLENVTTNDAGLYEVIITNITTGLPGLAKQSDHAELVVLADSDHDGMPDVWEDANGLNSQDPADADRDDDEDEMSNYEEYCAGTDPGVGASYLHVATLETGDSVTLNFLATSNRTYTVEYTDGLDHVLWLKLADLVAHSTNQVESLPDPQWNPQRYYRLATPRQPDPD